MKAFQDSAQTRQIVGALNQAGTACRLELSGLTGAQEAFVLAGVVAAAKERSHLCIANSKEEAAYLQNDLQGVLSEQAIHFFPDSFKRASFFDDLNPTQVLQRSETVNKISGPAPNSKVSSTIRPGEVIVTYPEALFEKVVSPEALNKNRIEITIGERLDVDFVMQVLIEYGFVRTDFVYEPGQFSIRGGIIDLFSYGNDLPYRIELFDDEVETIRIFDPLSQLSKQNIKHISIVPNLNTRFRQDQKVSLLRVLPPGTVLWVKDFQFLLDRLQYCFDKAELFASKLTALDDAELRDIFRDRAFLYPGDVVEDVLEMPIIFVK